MLPIPMIPSVALVTSTPSQSTVKHFVSGETATWQPECKYMLNGYKLTINIERKKKFLTITAVGLWDTPYKKSLLILTSL